MSSEIDLLLGRYGGPSRPGYAAGGGPWDGPLGQPGSVASPPGTGWPAAMTGLPASPPYQSPSGTNQATPPMPTGQPVPPSGLAGPFAGGPNVAAMPPMLMQPGMADGGAVDDVLGEYTEPSAPSLLDRAWDARPWKGYAENPPSTLPQLGIALGLLHPRLGGATRDLSMARGLAAAGDKPAALPSGMGLPRREAGITNPEGVSLGPTGTYRPETVEQFLAAHGMHVRNPSAEADRILGAAHNLSVNRAQRPPTPAIDPVANANVRALSRPAPPELRVVADNKPAPSPYKPGSRVAAYEAYVNSLPDGVTPVHFRTFVREFLD